MRTSIPFTLKLLPAVLFLPAEMSFFVFGLRLTLTRLLFLAISPFLVAGLIKKASSGHYRFVFSDFFVAAIGFWMICAPANIDGLGPALNHGGPDVLEFCTGYMTTRIMLSEHGQALRFIDLLCRAIAIVAIVGLIDCVTGSYITHRLAAQLTGWEGEFLPNWADAYRLGLLRAAGPIEQPILFGFICGCCLVIALATPIRQRALVILASGLGAILALSSAPLLAALLGIGLLLYDRMVPKFRSRWLILAAILASPILAMILAGKSPVGFVISNLTFTPETGYYREWTWDRVTYYVSRSPWFGLGFGSLPEEINHTIDSLWLVLAIRYGFPGAILFLATLIGAAFPPTSGRNVDLTPAESRLGTSIGIIIFLTFYISFTVDLWGTCWIFVGLLLGLKAHLAELGQLQLGTRLRVPVQRRQNPLSCPRTVQAP